MRVSPVRFRGSVAEGGHPVRAPLSALFREVTEDEFIAAWRRSIRETVALEWRT